MGEKFYFRGCLILKTLNIIFSQHELFLSHNVNQVFSAPIEYFQSFPLLYFFVFEIDQS